MKVIVSYSLARRSRLTQIIRGSREGIAAVLRLARAITAAAGAQTPFVMVCAEPFKFIRRANNSLRIVPVNNVHGPTLLLLSARDWTLPWNLGFEIT